MIWPFTKSKKHNWDRALNKALDKFEPKYIDQYYSKVGPFLVWTENWPYAYGKLNSSGPPPYMKTRRRLYDAIVDARLTEEINKSKDAE